MAALDNRREGVEAKFARDEDLRFKAVSRRNRLLGAWAAEKLGKSGSDAEGYANEVVRADFEEAGEEDVVRKVKRDFEAAGLDESDQDIRQAMQRFLAEAVRQIEEGR